MEKRTRIDPYGTLILKRNMGGIEREIWKHSE